MDSGVAGSSIDDMEAYKEELARRLGIDNKLLKNITQKAKRNPKTVVFAEADNYKILKAAQIVHEEGIAKPILLGKVKKIEEVVEKYNLEIDDIPIIDPRSSSQREIKNKYAQQFYEARKRRGKDM